MTSRDRARQPRVLVVDDDLTMRVLVREALEGDGMHVREAEDAARALACVEEDLPDLVLLDVQMPRQDGFAVCRHIRALPEGRDLPVVMMTGSDDVQAIRRAYEAGATDFVVKPMNWLILGHRIRYLIRADENVRELRRGRERLGNAQRIARMGSWELEPPGREVVGSEELGAILGLPFDGKPFPAEALLERVHPEDREDLEAALLACADGGPELCLDHRIVRPDGTVRRVQSQARLVPAVAGRGAMLEGIVHDVTERREAEEQIRYLSNHDSLTGLPNRKLFQERLEVALARARRHEVALGVLFLDLDHFRRINDTLGHSAGDQLLQEVARRLGSSVRTTDFIARQHLDSTIARPGGDEFAILIGDLDEIHNLAKVAGRILEVLAEPFTLGGHRVVITASIGITTGPADGEDVETLLRNADTSLNHAKEQGRNRYQFYRDSMNEAAMRKLGLESGLRRALEREEFELHYQPKIDAKTGGVTGLEALLRWRAADGVLIPPATFIPVAEETGLIEPLGEWIFRRACLQVAEWERRFAPCPRVSVNLSTKQFRSGTLAATLRRIVRETAVDPARLEVEITESILLHDKDRVVEALEELRRMGVRVCLDDFGTGYSSLGYLRQLPVDTLKIDRCFVADLEQRDVAALTAAIISMGKALGLRVTAEGVETEAQRARLADLGCDDMQGFLFHAAVPSGEIEAIVRARGREPERRRPIPPGESAV